MQSSDFSAFAQTWACAWEQVGKSITAGAIELAFESLKDYEINDIRRALTAHMRDPQRGRFAPTVADIVAVVDQGSILRWPSPDEAWSICVRTYDEMETAIVTDEIMHARSVAQPIMDIGDEVGARMAFRDAYASAVTAAKFTGTKPRWWLSGGMDHAKRLQRITEAVELGLLPKSELPALPSPTITDALRALDHVANTDASRKDKAERVRGMLAALKDQIETRRENDIREEARRRENRRRDAEARRAEVVARADERLAEKANGTNG